MKASGTPRNGRAGNSLNRAVEGRPLRASGHGPSSLRFPAALEGPGHAFHGMPARTDRCSQDIGLHPARPVARPGVCRETGRNLEPGANLAGTLPTDTSTQFCDSTLVTHRGRLRYPYGAGVPPARTKWRGRRPPPAARSVYRCGFSCRPNPLSRCSVAETAGRWRATGILGEPFSGETKWTLARSSWSARWQRSWSTA